MDLNKSPIVEIFAPIYINGEKTHFMISDHGRCYNLKNNKFLTGTINSNGRKIIGLKYKGVFYRKTAARWIALSFIKLPYGDDPSIFQADHIDEDFTNDTLDNIQWITGSENVIKHYSLKHNEHIGENNQYSILTSDIVHLIFKDAIENNMRPVEISDKYNISRFTIQKILSGINWKHIYSQYDMSNYNPGHGVRSKYSDETIQLIFDLYERGYKSNKIRKKLKDKNIDISESYINKIIRNSKS